MRPYLSVLHSRFPRLCSRRSSFGSALTETAIVMPLYMIVLFGLIYFGYATLSKQRQILASAYSALVPGVQRADRMLARFWPWENSPAPGQQQGSLSLASARDTTVALNDSPVPGDPYYGTLLRTQLIGGIHSLGSSGSNTFDRERVGVSLWTLALGEVTQYFDFVPGQGLSERVDTRYDEVAAYLNANAPGAGLRGGGFIVADTSSPPVLGRYEEMVAGAFDGPPPGRWLDRRQVQMEVTYHPWFFRQVVADAGSPSAGFQTHVSGSYEEPLLVPTTATTFDLTGRGTAERRTLGEGNNSPQILDEMRVLLVGGALQSPDDMDDMPIGNLGMLRDLWRSR